jgi:hypothetical protein
MYYGDENRPGTGTAGGAYFIPTTPVERSAGSLQFSPTAGSVYGCTRIGTLNDLTAEWTGGVFDKFGATSTRAFSKTFRVMVSCWHYGLAIA